MSTEFVQVNVEGFPDPVWFEVLERKRNGKLLGKGHVGTNGMSIEKEIEEHEIIATKTV